jgi:hypothetical protein
MPSEERSRGIGWGAGAGYADLGFLEEKKSEKRNQEEEEGRKDGGSKLWRATFGARLPEEGRRGARRREEKRGEERRRG